MDVIEPSPWPRQDRQRTRQTHSGEIAKLQVGSACNEGPAQELRANDVPHVTFAWACGRNGTDNPAAGDYINRARHVRAFGVRMEWDNDGYDTIERRP
jgi:hypothetical protein